MKVQGIGLTFDYNWVFSASAPFFGHSTTTQTMAVSLAVNLNRVYLKDKGFAGPYAALDPEPLLEALDPGEFFLLSSGCCPCAWSFLPKFPDSTVAGTFSTDVHYDPGFGTSGHASGSMRITAGFALESKAHCGRAEYVEQGPHWPSFDPDNATQDPVHFPGLGIGAVLEGVDNPDAIPFLSDGDDPGLAVGPYGFNPNEGVFYGWDYIDGAMVRRNGLTSFAGHGFRQPCDPDDSFEQSVAWSGDTRTNEGTPATGSGTGLLRVAWVAA